MFQPRGFLLKDTSQDKTNTSTENKLTSARLDLNHSGLFVATDSTTSKLLIFARSKADIESLLKPFHNVDGANVASLCTKGLQFDFIDQRDLSIQQLLNATHLKGESGNGQASQPSTPFQRFRSTITGAAQDYVLASILKSTASILIGRNNVLVPRKEIEAETFSSSPSINDNAVRILRIESDFSSNGRVVVNITSGYAQTLSYFVKERDAGDVYVLPLFQEAKVLDLDQTNPNLPNDTVNACRSLARSWLISRGFTCPNAEDDYRWSKIQLIQSGSNHDLQQRTVASKDPDFIEWPTNYCFIQRLQTHSDEPAASSKLFQPDLNIFRFAVEWQNSKPERDATIEKEIQRSLKPPPIPPEMCQDISMSDTDPSNDAMRDIGTDGQATGIYPTPSDGPLSHQTPASSSYDSPTVPSSQNRDQATSSSNETHGAPKREPADQKSSVHVFNDSLEAHRPSLAKEPTPGLATVTENDFDFFDKPVSKPKPNIPLIQRETPSAIIESAAQEDASDETVITERQNVSSSQGGKTVELTMQSDTQSHPMDVDRPTEVIAKDFLFRRLTKEAVNNRIHSINDVNSKYSERGLYRHASEKRPEQRVEKSDDTSGVPHVGFPASRSSDSDPTECTDSDDSENENGTLISQGETASEDDRGRSLLRERMEHRQGGNPTGPSGHSTSNFEKAKALFESRGMSLPSGDIDLPNPAYAWSDLEWIFGDLEEQARIDAMQLTTEQVIRRASKLEEEALALKPFLDITKLLPAARPLELISLLLPLDSRSENIGRINPAELSPKSRRGDQEARSCLRRLLVEIDSPHLKISRHGSPWSVLPTAAQFWESLGLGPASGPKNISAACVAPAGSPFLEGIKQFHWLMQDAYMSQQLGQYSALDEQGGFYQVAGIKDLSNVQNVMTVYRQTCISLGAQLSNHDFASSKLIVFLVDIYEDMRSLVPLSVCFFHLLQAFISKCEERRADVDAGDIQFRVIPASWVSWEPSESIVHFPQANRKHLAFDLYDSFACTSGDRPLNLTMDASPAIELERTLPKSIPFDMTSHPPSHLFLQDSSLHLAYTYTSQRNWLVASWTDETGRYQSTMTYPLKHQQLSVILKEIWETTLEFLDVDVARDVRWWLHIVKVGVLQQDELAIWKHLIAPDRRPRNISLDILSMDTTPKFTITIPAPSDNGTANRPSDASPTSAFHTPSTPNTPTAHPTSGPDADPSARLVNLTQQSWSALFHTPPNTSPTSYSPALASGLLLKRRTPRPTDPPVFIQVNLMYRDHGADMKHRISKGLVESITGFPRPGVDPVKAGYDEVLKEILKSYRGLAVLARVRGYCGAGDTRPVHVMRVERAVGGLEKLVGL